MRTLLRGVQRQRGISATFTGFELSADRERHKPPLNVYTGCKRILLNSCTSYRESRTFLAFTESENDQLCACIMYLYFVY